MKQNRSDIEFYQNMMDFLQHENASLKEQLDAERKAREDDTKQILEENRALREEIIDYAKQLRESEERRNAEQKEIASYAKQLRDREESEKQYRDKKDAEHKELMNHIMTLQAELANALAAVRLGRGKRFAASTEKSSLAGKSRSDKRADEKDDFDGTPPAGGSSSSSENTNGDKTKQEGPKKEKKKSAGRKPSLENYDCDEVVRHELSDYFTLPEGATFKTSNGQTETHEYISFEYVPGRVIKHVWVTASYQDAVGDIRNTLPKEERRNPVKGCPFSAEMLAFILVEKYAYHTPKNRIKKKLREMGALFAKSTFVRYYSLAASALRNMLESTLHHSIRESKYLMIDETCELVGVIDSDTGIPQYRKRYLWAFYNPFAATVVYLYEKGSRARKVVTDMLSGFKGTISTDGYEAYRIFDTDSHPNVLHCGCWAHVRRKVLESLGVATDMCNDFLAMIQELFVYEKMFSGLDSETRQKKRAKFSRPIVNRIFDMADRVASDSILMGRDLLKKAVNYIRNQKESLRNFLKDGSAELSNNLCEQRMKPIKLDLKNSQNIGSEDAAENAAFMHSLVESCRMNSKNPYDYLVDLLRKLGKPIDDASKRLLLPDQWQPKC